MLSGGVRAMYSRGLKKLKSLRKLSKVSPLRTGYAFDFKVKFLSPRNITMCSILMDGKQGVAVEVILGRPVFSSFLTVSATN